jgi:hypothetical protein
MIQKSQIIDPSLAPHIKVRFGSSVKLLNLQTDEEGGSSIFTRERPTTVEEMADSFREGGMHPSKAAQIILKGVKKNKRRIFIGLDSKLLELSQRIFPNKYHRLWPFFMIPMMIFRNKKPLKSLD